MKKYHLQFILSLLLLMHVSFFAQPALAHGDEPRLEINPERLNPGAVLEIRGVDFEFEEEIALSLIGPQTEHSLGAVTGDVEGVFQFIVTLPADLAEGIYIIRAVTDDHTIESPQFTVWGTAQLEGGEGVREEDDGLLAPMPTFAPAAETPAVPVVVPAEVEPAQTSTSAFVWAFAAIGVILLAALFRFVKL